VTRILQIPMCHACGVQIVAVGERELGLIGLVWSLQAIVRTAEARP